jgi:hypothetical protein
MGIFLGSSRRILKILIFPFHIVPSALPDLEPIYKTSLARRKLRQLQAKVFPQGKRTSQRRRQRTLGVPTDMKRNTTHPARQTRELPKATLRPRNLHGEPSVPLGSHSSRCLHLTRFPIQRYIIHPFGNTTQAFPVEEVPHPLLGHRAEEVAAIAVAQES